MEDGSEFSAVPIRGDQLVSWPRVAAVSAMVGFSLPTFLTGIEIFSGLSPADALSALMIGSVIIVIIGAIMGYIGAADRMSSYLLVRVAFGDRGAAWVNIAFAVSLMGWFGLNINLFMDTVGRLAQDLWGLNIPRLAYPVYPKAERRRLYLNCHLFYCRYFGHGSGRPGRRGVWRV